MATSCAGIIPNPDLAGIGTRLNFYVTILITALIPQSKSTTELLNSLYLNAIFYGLAILITAFVQTIQRQLDLYHAIIVMQMILSLLLLHGFGMRRYISANKIDFKMKMIIAVQILSLFIFYPWSFYVWISASRFGPQPECNDLVKFVLAFCTFQVTVLWARYLCMTILAMTTFTLLCNLTVIYNVRKAYQGYSQPQSHAWTEVEKGKVPANEIKVREKGMWKRLKRLLIAVSWVLCVLSAVVSAASTELTVHRNRPYVQAGEGAWGFGQVVSVILIIPSIIEVLAWVLDNWISWVLRVAAENRPG